MRPKIGPVVFIRAHLWIPLTAAGCNPRIYATFFRGLWNLACTKIQVHETRDSWA